MSEFLKALNARKGDRTLAEYAEVFDISPSALSRILRGHSSISADILRRIFQVYPELFQTWLTDNSGDDSSTAAVA